ncbi:PTS sugar transporter subunit IIC [Romboutsia sp.]|uniref:PTS sugar transporter subunit IIC n=1 Tax=Romboutsia sp. TaxID=1965302 RepID=UPI003F2CADE5
MNKFLEILEKFMTPISMKISSNKVLQSVKDAFILSIPFTVVGSFVGLIKMQLEYFTKGAENNLLTSLINVLGTVGDISMALIGVVIVMASAYYLSEKLKTKENNINSMIVALLALVAYMATIPTTILEPESGNIISGYARNFFNYEGMFTGLIVGLVTAFLYNKLIQTKMTINLPDGVPPGILNSFKSIIPMAIIITMFALVKELVMTIGYESLQEMITKLIVSPLSDIGTGLPAIIIVIVFMQLLWFFGLHGFSIMWGLISAIWLPVFMNHIDIYARTQDFSAITEVAPNVMSNIYAMIGGSGSTLALIIAILLIFKKESSERAIAKISLVPGLFNINEPIIFGLPIVLNPIMFIPFIFVPVINAVIAYFATASGLVTPMVVLNAGVEPVLLNAWVLGAFKLSPVLLMLALLVLDVVIYAPFVKVLQKQNEKKLEDSSDVNKIINL